MNSSGRSLVGGPGVVGSLVEENVVHELTLT
jgi:hypothetical protein